MLDKKGDVAICPWCHRPIIGQGCLVTSDTIVCRPCYQEWVYEREQDRR